jgi:small subunit ribosomal protein S20
MPVTKTAKRALRGSKNKRRINELLLKRLEIALRSAKKTKKIESVIKAVSLTDRAAKKQVIHKNKAARIKSQLSKLISGKAKPKATKKVLPKKSKAA